MIIKERFWKNPDERSTGATTCQKINIWQNTLQMLGLVV
jgi:hypothetical protein